MKTFKTETYLPVFTGFYETIFEPDADSEIYEINQIRQEKGFEEIDFNDCNFNYKEYKENVCIDCTEFLGKEFKRLNVIESIEFQKLYSPSFYNFENDTVHVLIEFSEQNIKNIDKILHDNYERFKKYIKNKYTSYDGFMSFHSDNCDNWLMDITDTLQDMHKAGSILDFICILEDINEMDLIDNCDTCLYALNYSELTEQEVIS